MSKKVGQGSSICNKLRRSARRNLATWPKNCKIQGRCQIFGQFFVEYHLWFLPKNVIFIFMCIYYKQTTKHIVGPTRQHNDCSYLQTRAYPSAHYSTLGLYMHQNHVATINHNLCTREEREAEVMDRQSPFPSDARERVIEKAHV